MRKTATVAVSQPAAPPSSRTTITIAGYPRWRIATSVLIFMHLGLGLAAPYLLLTGNTALGTLAGMLLIGMLSLDILLTYYRQSWVILQPGEMVGEWSRSRWQFPLRAITAFVCVGVISGTLVGIALQGQPALAAKANVGVAGKLALLADNAAGLAFSPDGTTVVLATPIGLALMNHATGAITRQLAAPAPGLAAGQGPISLAWHDQLLAATYPVATTTGDTAYAVTAWHVDTGAVRFTAPLDSAMSGLAWSPDGTTLAGYRPPATAGTFGVIMQWDVATGKSKAPIFIINGAATAQRDTLFAWAPEPDHMAVVNDSHTVLLVDLRVGDSSERFIDTYAITALAWSPNGTSLAIGHSDGSVSLLDIPTMTVTRTIAMQPHAVVQLAWSPDSTRLAVADSDADLGVTTIAKVLPAVALIRPVAPHLPGNPVVSVGGPQSYNLAANATDAAPTVVAVMWSADGAGVSARYSDGALVSWDATAIDG